MGFEGGRWHLAGEGDWCRKPGKSTGLSLAVAVRLMSSGLSESLASSSSLAPWCGKPDEDFLERSTAASRLRAAGPGWGRYLTPGSIIVLQHQAVANVECCIVRFCLYCFYSAVVCLFYPTLGCMLGSDAP